MKNLFGIILTVVGLLVMAIGLKSIWEALGQQQYLILGAVLMPVGGGVAFLGGVLTAHWDVSAAEIEGKKIVRRWPISKALFAVCFLASVGVAVFGVWFIFEGWEFIYLLVIGIVGAFPSALAALAQE